jgi:hypothetical protein
MTYKEMSCGIRVDTPRGPGVVKSFEADFMMLWSGGFGSAPKPLRATVHLDSGPTIKVRISRLKKHLA